MSIKAITKVWETSKQSGSALLMLLAIADYAKDDGSNAWPSLQTLAGKTRMSRRNAIKLVQKLEEAGELQVRREKGPHGTNFYDIIFQDAVNPSSPQDNQGSEPQFTPPVNPSSPEVVNPSSPNTSYETSSNRHLEPNGNSSSGKKEYTNQHLIFGLLAKLCKYDLQLLTDKQRGQLNKESKRLAQVDIRPEQIEQFSQWWYANDWRGKKGQPPIPSQVSECWGQFKEPHKMPLSDKDFIPKKIKIDPDGGAYF